jgi:thioredoxin 1
MSELMALSDENKGKLVVVKFGASWCQPCKMYSPVYEQLAREHPDCVWVQCDAAKDLTSVCEVTALPTTLFYKDGKFVDKVVGFSLDEVKQKVNCWQA